MDDKEKLNLVIEGLQFYALVKNWISPSTGFALQYDPEKSPIQEDMGAKASKYLEMLKVI